MWDYRGRAIYDAEKIDPDIAFPNIRAGFPKGFGKFRRWVGTGIAGIVDQYADWAEIGLGLGHHVFDGFMVGDVGLQCYGFAAIFSNLFCDRFGALQNIIIHDNTAAILCGGQVQRGLAPDTLACACNQRDAPTEIQYIRHTFLSLSFQ